MASLNSNKFTISFSKQNQDIREDLIKKKNNNINISNYICDAIRFYEKNKNKQDISDIDNLIDNKLKELLKTIDINVSNNNEQKEEVTSLETLAATNNFINIEDD